MEEQEKKDLDDCIAKVTRNATRWSFKVFSEWQISRNNEERSHEMHNVNKHEALHHATRGIIKFFILHPLFIYLPCYFEIPGATLKSLPRPSGLLGESPGITTYSRVLRNSSDWSKRLLNMDEYFKAYTSHFRR